MPHATTPRDAPDSGLACIVLLARLHQIAVDPDQLKHRFARPGEPFDELAMLRASRDLGLKARELVSSWERLADTPLPAIARHNDGHYFLILKASADKVLIHDPLERRPLTLPREVFEPGWSGRLILTARRSLLAGSTGRFDFRWFVPALVKYRHLFGEVLLASFFLQLFALMTPLFFQVVIDKVLVHHGLTTLDVLAIGLLVLSLFEVFLGGLRTYLFSHTTSRVDVELGAKLFRHLQSLPIAYFAAHRVGETVARVRELETVRSFLTGSALTVVIDLFFTVVFLAVMYYYSPTLTYVVLGAVPCYVLLSVVVTPLLRARLKEKFARGAENQAFLVESVNGVETLKAMAVEPQTQNRWEEQLAEYVRTSFHAAHLGNLATQAATLINKLTTVALLWLGARLVLEGELSVGQLIAFNMLSGRVSAPILRVVQLWQDFQQAGISVQRLGDIFNTPAEAGHRPGRAALPKLAGRIGFEHVGFRYQPDRPEALSDLSFEIAAGQVVGIVGRSGSGKSTLGKLIQRLYIPERGRVLIDGHDLALVDPTALRRRVGVVLQENVLFNRSVRDNIALADPGLPMDAVVRAAQLAGAHDFILELPEGYDTVVGEHGASLSGGQRQRIAIARALVSDPRVLIFDEATSALDYESERVVQENMRAICRGRTVIIIAHRLSTLRHADRILVLDRGRLVEDGSPAELLADNGHYARLHALQMG